jgi:hypothetical protein
MASSLVPALLVYSGSEFNLHDILLHMKRPLKFEML